MSRVRYVPVPGDSGTTLSVLEDEGDCFPTPPFIALVWPTQTLPQLGPDWPENLRNAEEVNVIGVLGDGFTIERSAWPINITSAMMISALKTQPTYEIGDPYEASYTFATDNPPYTFVLRDPHGANTTVGELGTAQFEGTVASGGQWRWLFEDADGLRSPEFDFFAHFSSVAS